MFGFARHVWEADLRYSITRRYQFGRWFKLGVTIGCVLVFAFLIVFNIATNGFDKQTRYTFDPNTTESRKEWYNNKFFTWGDDSLAPKCQTAELSVGQKIITTNAAQRYTVRRILFTPHKPGSSELEERGSLSYKRNTLQNCDVDRVNLEMRKSSQAKPDPVYRWWHWLDSSADALSHCDILNDDGKFTMEFASEYRIDGTDFGSFVRNATSHASFWWGAHLMNAYFQGMQFMMQYPLPDSSPYVFQRAQLGFIRTNVTDMKDPKLFANAFHFLTDDGNVRDPYNTKPENGSYYNNPSYPLSRALTEGLFFAKVYRSLILADLGNTALPNMLLEDDLLTYALNPGKDDFNRLPNAPLNKDNDTVDWFKFNGIPPPSKQNAYDGASVPLPDAKAKLSSQTGQLKPKNNSTTIYTEYVCAVPEMKSTLAVVLFSLATSLALFQTLWLVFKYLLEQKVSRNDPTANYCEGCVANIHELKELHKKRHTPTESRTSTNRHSQGSRESSERLLSSRAV